MTNIEQKVYIVDDDPDIADVIQRLLQSVGIIGIAFSSAEAFLANYKPGEASCLILDIRMQGMSGLQLQKILHEKGDAIPIIFITGHGDIPMTKRALQAGAADFFTKPFNNHELIESVQNVLQQNAIKQQQHQQKAEILARYDSLSAREKEVMQHVINGMSNRQIAKEFKLSISTVETHRSRIMSKMQVKSLAELVKLAVLHGLA